MEIGPKYFFISDLFQRKNPKVLSSGFMRFRLLAGLLMIGLLGHQGFRFDFDTRRHNRSFERCNP